MRISDWSSDVFSSDLDVFFHLDPLWASPAIDAVGIDNYMPLSVWRDEDLGDANPDDFRLADDRAAMRAQIGSGEGFDWYYASDADRRDRIRTPITDGSAGKPWVYRYKDIGARSEEHTSELQSLMRISYAVFCLKKKTQENTKQSTTHAKANTNN